MSITLLVKLASLAVHADEFLSPQGHPADADAIRGLLLDPEIRAALADLDRNALLPVRRDGSWYGEPPT